MRRIVVLASLTLALSALEVAAQVMPQPFTKRPVTKEELVAALKANDMSILNIEGEEWVKTIHRAFGSEYEIIKTRHDLADWISRMSEAVCPVETVATFARIMPRGSIDLYGYSRNCRSGERWLYDNQAGIFTISLNCGNVVTKNELPVPYLAPVVVTPDPVEQAAPTRSLSESARQAGEQIAETSPAQEGGWNPKSSQNFFSLKRRSGKIFLASSIAAVVGGILLAQQSKTTVTVTNEIYR